MSRVPAVGLTACILGLLISPFFLVAAGTPLHLPAPWTVVLPGAAAAASIFLLVRSLMKPSTHVRGLPIVLVEIVCLGVVLGFLGLMANTVFISSSRRVGFAATLLLCAWIFCLPLPLIRRTALEQLVSRMPKGIAVAMLVALLSGTATFAYGFFSRPEHLI